MPDNEYMLQYVARERMREAEARASLYSLLDAGVSAERPKRDRWRRLMRWWHVTIARATHLALPKFANRL
jgi:hypothetical protein